MQPMSTAQLTEIAQAASTAPACGECAALVCPGWESMPAGFDARSQRLIGSLRTGEEEPTWEEYHPQGTRAWSADAPIALGYHPYNRCDVYACRECGRAFLRYTEFGGYYEEPRIRELDAALIVEAPSS